jgi:dihydrodipicolinate synthase/N-acetylneuraminate lyase
MPMTGELTLICRTVTTFSESGALDLDAQAEFLERLAECGHGFYLASAGSGEGHALTRDEIRRLYGVGRAVSAGRVPVNANPPEAHTPRGAIEHARLAAECGVDVINIYGPTAWHGFRPTEAELIAYHDEVFAEVRHPCALAPNPVIGYTPTAAAIAKICERHHQVVAINLAGLDDRYFFQLRDALTRPVDIYVPFVSAVHTLSMGAAGLLGAEANIIPKTFREYLDHFETGDLTELGRTYVQLQRFTAYVRPWHHASPRWLKMAMAVLDLPGGRGGLRSPYLMPPSPELEQFASGLAGLGIPEIDSHLATAGAHRG